jgi:hypothetical protein
MNVGPEEIRAEKRQAMGKKLGELHYHLANELHDLWWFWKDLLELFGKDQKRIDLLNEAAGGFFGRLEREMWLATLLHLSRMTDREQVAGKDTLSVRALPSLIDDEGLRREVEAAIELAKERTQFARDWRNRQIAHTERPPLDDTPANSLPIANRPLVEAALAALGNVLNLVETRFSGIPMSYGSGGQFGRGVRHLVHYLELGLASERETVAANRSARQAAEGSATQPSEGGSEAAT